MRIFRAVVGGAAVAFLAMRALVWATGADVGGSAEGAIDLLPILGGIVGFAVGTMLIVRRDNALTRPR
jgi:hypothetical protein